MCEKPDLSQSVALVRRVGRLAGWSLTALAILAGVARGALGPENTAVVVNSDSWASQAVANEFIHLRQIPPGNVVYLALGRFGNFETASVSTFRDKILQPVIDTLTKRGLGGQIDCIAYSSDIPTAIHIKQDMGNRKLPKTFTLVASVNGLTYLYALVQKKDPRYVSAGANLYYRQIRRVKPRQLLSKAQDVQLVAAYGMMKKHKWLEAEQALTALADKHPNHARLHYSIARCRARLGLADDAIESLTRSVDSGWWNVLEARSEADLRTLRAKEAFAALMARAVGNKPPYNVAPTLGFSRKLSFRPDGSVAMGGTGMRYLLSTVLAVTSGRGNSVDEAIEMLRRSKAADSTAPTGTVYFMVNSDIRSRARQPMFPLAISMLARIGLSAQAIAGTMPIGKTDVIGAMLGSETFDWAKSRSTILPGAICEHLTSTGGVMHQRGTQTPISEFIRYGAAGTSGTVTEPYAIAAKFPSPLIHYHYARGCTLAEAFYQSVAQPYQLLIVGDPLSRPWAKAPAVGLEGLTDGARIKGTVEITPRITPPPGKRVTGFGLVVDGKFRQGAATGSAAVLDTTALADGYHELRVVTATSDLVQMRGSAGVGIIVDNLGESVVVTGPQDSAVPWARRIELSARAEGARRIEFFHNARRVGKIQGASGKVEIDSALLGMGPVRIFAVATMPDAGDKPARTVVSRPVDLVVQRPVMRTASPIRAGRPAGGLKVTNKTTARSVVVADAIDNDMLDRAGIAKGQSFSVEGLFVVREQGLHQFQIFFTGALAVQIDGRVLPMPASKWRFLPVVLSKGTHRLRIEGKVRDSTRFDLRFGRRGTRSVNSSLFSHIRGR